MANKKAVLSRPTPDASVARNAFDRESMRVYHYSLGQLLPVWFEPVIAGSKIKLNRKIFQRTASLKTAAFPLIDTHLQYYFVPFRQLWSLWPSFKTGIKDVHSTGLVGSASESGIGDITMPTRVPYTDFTDIEAALAQIESTSQVDIFGNSNLGPAKKLLNLLGYGYPDKANGLTEEVNLWPILAYHKIYYDHFRNTQYENNYARTYNMDYLWTRYQSMKLPASELYQNRGLLTLHHVNYRNDYFTNMYPSLTYVQISALALANGTAGLPYLNAIGIPSNIVGNGSSQQVTLSGNTGNNNDYTLASNADITGSTFTARMLLNQVSPGGSSHALATDSSGNGYRIAHNHPLNTSVNLQLQYNVQQIRAQFAYDKLLRSSAYAPQHAKDQYEARFGIKYPDDGNESYYIGAFKNDIQIGEVTSTANTVSGGSGDALGAIGGKGVGFDDWGKTLDFNAKEDGIVMAVQYSTVRSCYRSAGIDSYLTKHLPEDYFQPEFMNLGLEPVYGLEFNQSLGTSTVLGYRPRNQRYKLGIDKSYGLFSDVNSDMSMFINHTDVSRVPTVGQSGVNYGWFKVKEADLDSVMEVTYDGTWNTDQFFGQTIFGCTVIQNMSVHGQPSL